MILGINGIVASQIAQVDPDAAAFFARVTADGGSLTITEQTATNQLVLDLKANSLWTPMKAIYPMVGASAAACKQNLKSSSFTGAFSSGWTFASTGVTPTNGYMNTGLNISSNLSLNNTHYSYYSRTNIIAGQVEMGAVGSSGSYLIYNYNNVAYAAINSAEAFRTTPASPTTGLLIGSRIVNTQERYYTNNVAQTRVSTSAASLLNLNVFLGCYNDGGNPSQYTSKQCAFASIGDGLTDTEASNFYTAVQAFQTTLSRNV